MVTRIPTASSSPPCPHRVHVAGLRIVPAHVSDSVDLVWDDVAHGSAHVFAFVNGYSATLRRTSAAYAQALRDDRVVGLPDGAAITLGARSIGLGDIGRAPGPDVFSAACQRAAEDGTTFFLLGGQPGVAEVLRDKLTATYPGLVVAGTATPPFGEWSQAETQELVARVHESRAQVLWLGVSAPKQETWALRNLAELRIPAVCVGAAFDFLAGAKPRAPRWMRGAGLEWAFRLGSEPRRLWRRYLIGNARFLGDLALYRGAPVDADADTDSPTTAG